MSEEAKCLTNRQLLLLPRITDIELEEYRAKWSGGEAMICVQRHLIRGPWRTGGVDGITTVLLGHTVQPPVPGLS